MYCWHCGNQIPEQAVICVRCGVGTIRTPGVPFTAPGAGPYALPPKSRVVYVLLAIFLGAFGIHNFYAGHTNHGLIQLLVSLFTCGFVGWVMWIWALLEAATVTTDAQGFPFGD